MPQSRVLVRHDEHGKSWMLPAATGRSWFLPDSKKTSLLYATDGNGDVLLYSFPKGRLVGTLTGFGQAAGLCTDSQQDVFITDSAFHEVVEYAHGGTTPIATITEESGNYPIACSVDPHTNNLAVANELPGDIAVFQNSQGSPKIFGYNQADFWSCAFDDGSNLYISGYANNFILELSKGSEGLTKISVARLSHGGSLHWDGQYLALDSLPRSRGATNIVRISVQGSIGSIVDTVALRTTGRERLSSAAQYWSQASTIIGAIGVHRGGAGIGFWNYPAGGRAFKAIKMKSSNVGVAVSVAPSR